MSYHICQEEGAFIANPSVLPLVQTTFLPALFIPVSLCLRNAFGAELVDTSTLLAMVLLNGLMFAHCAYHLIDEFCRNLGIRCFRVKPQKTAHYA